MVRVCDFAISPARRRRPHVPSSSVHTSSAAASCLRGPIQTCGGRIVLPEASPTTEHPFHPPLSATLPCHVPPPRPSASKASHFSSPSVRGSFTQFIYFLRGLSTTICLALRRSELPACLLWIHSPYDSCGLNGRFLSY